MESPGSLLARKMRGDTSITNEDIANSSLSYLRQMGAPVESVSVGAVTATARRAEDFGAGQHVRYVPYHAEGDTSHEDCENGIVSSANAETQTVFVRFGTGDTAQGCKPDQLR
jgi:hypothetical protein